MQPLQDPHRPLGLGTAAAATGPALGTAGGEGLPESGNRSYIMPYHYHALNAPDTNVADPDNFAPDTKPVFKILNLIFFPFKIDL